MEQIILVFSLNVPSFDVMFTLFMEYSVTNHYKHENIHTLAHENKQTFKKSNKIYVKLLKKLHTFI